MKRRLLLVTFPIDYGSTTWEKLLIKAFENHVDLKTYRFTPSEHRKSDPRELLRKRFFSTYQLWKEVYQAQREGRKILFQGISPALFACPATLPGTSCIVTDWTRKLYEPFYNFLSPSYTLPSPYWLTLIHRFVLNSQKCVIGVTDEVIREINKDYHVPPYKLRKANFPFSSNLDLFIPSPARNDEEIRLLFVGGDLRRKGGDVLLQWFLQQENSNLKLTMITKSSMKMHPKVTVRGNVNFGEPEHVELFSSHDIFVLPTQCDAYPTVLGEAACAGLCILTTRNALGAPEIIRNGVNGYICDSQASLLKQLQSLIANKPLIETMKQASRSLMEVEFSAETVINQFIDHIFED